VYASHDHFDMALWDDVADSITYCNHYLAASNAALTDIAATFAAFAKYEVRGRGGGVTDTVQIQYNWRREKPHSVPRGSQRLMGAMFTYCNRGRGRGVLVSSRGGGTMSSMYVWVCGEEGMMVANLAAPYSWPLQESRRGSRGITPIEAGAGS